MNRKKGINSDCIRGADERVTLELMKEAGFEAFFTFQKDTKELMSIKEKSVKLGLTGEFIHAPYKGINDMWMSGVSYWDIFKKMTDTIDNADCCDMRCVIIHVSSGDNAPQVNDLGLSRFDALVEYAEKKNVVLAFENLRKIGNLGVLVERYEKIDTVKFCYDCGHRHCYTPQLEWIDVFSEKLFCTHIHDNLGRTVERIDDDLHLLPLDGNFDFESMMKLLDRADYQGTLMLEVFNTAHPLYRKLGAEKFIKKAYDRLTKIIEM